MKSKSEKAILKEKLDKFENNLKNSFKYLGTDYIYSYLIEEAKLTIKRIDDLIKSELFYIENETDSYKSQKKETKLYVKELTKENIINKKVLNLLESAYKEKKKNDCYSKI
jgi:hypothetical protein